MKRLTGIMALSCSLMIAGSATAQLTAPQSGTKSQVLIYAPSVSGGLSSPEATAVTSIPGLTPVTMTGPAWQSMTTAQFKSYRALIIGDDTCPSMSPPLPTAPIVVSANNWGMAVEGPAIVIGTDPTYHKASRPGATQLITSGIIFAASDAARTGAYITLSCHYHFSAVGTAVSMLGGPSIGLGEFKVMGSSFVANKEDAHIVASHPALAGLTDADLASWSNSVHNGFTSWPSGWNVLALTRDPGGPFTAPRDGTKGYPYILARAEGLVVGNITLGPAEAKNPLGSKHTVTATVMKEGKPQAGVVVTFTILSGPHAGQTGTATTNSAGQASWTYTGTMAGTDAIQATAEIDGVKQESNVVRKEWVGSPADPCCATLEVQPFPDPPTNNDVRTFTIKNPVPGRPICFVEIKWSSVPAFYTGGGPGTASYGGILVDGQVEGPGAGSWFAAPYSRIPKTGMFSSSSFPFTVPAPAGAKKEISFNLGVDYVWATDNAWTGSVMVIVHYCDRTVCELEYGPWTPGPPREVFDGPKVGERNGPTIRQDPRDPRAWTFELDAKNSANAPKWVGFSAGTGQGLMVNSGMVRGGGRLERMGAVAAQLAPNGLRPNSALFVLPEGMTTGQFDVRVTGEVRNPQVRWTTYGEDGSPLQTGTISSRQGPDQSEPGRPNQPRRN